MAQPFRVPYRPRPGRRVPAPGSWPNCETDSDGFVQVDKLGPATYFTEVVPPPGPCNGNPDSQWYQTTTIDGGFELQTPVEEGATGAGPDSTGSGGARHDHAYRNGRGKGSDRGGTPLDFRCQRARRFPSAAPEFFGPALPSLTRPLKILDCLYCLLPAVPVRTIEQGHCDLSRLV
jgi:hypothetical protein